MRPVTSPHFSKPKLGEQTRDPPALKVKLGKLGYARQDGVTDIGRQTIDDVGTGEVVADEHSGRYDESACATVKPLHLQRFSRATSVNIGLCVQSLSGRNVSRLPASCLKPLM
jgi:hypothetical protein